MGLQSESKQIGRFKYKVTQLPFGQGRRLLVRVTKSLGPVLAKALGEVQGGATVKALKGRVSIAAAIEEFSQRISNEDLDAVCEAFGSSSCLLMDDGKKPDLTVQYQELHFAGHYAEWIEWLAFAAEVNWRDFFDMASAPLGDAQEAETAAPPA